MSDFLDRFKETLLCLRRFGTETVNKHPHFVYKWFVITHVLKKLKELLKIQLNYRRLPDKVLRNSLEEQCEKLDYYVDCNVCVFVSSKHIKTPNWYYMCTLVTGRKYKVFVIPSDATPETEIWLSETILFNVNNHLGVTEDNYLFYFLIPVKEGPECAKTASVSLISSTQNYSNDLTQTLLENYFSRPRFLRRNDVFDVDIKEYAPEYFYTNEFSSLSTLHFKVNNIDNSWNTGKYVVKNETQLVQEANVNSYVPPQYYYPTKNERLFENGTMIDLKCNYPPCLEESFEEVKACVAPFLQNKSKMNIQSVFMVQGPQGCGKFVLIQALAKRIGVHFIHINFSEVRTLATGQKEAKIRMVLQGARNCVPCILLLRNIEILGINSEGKKDDRALATLQSEIKSIFEQESDFPLLVIATSEAKKIPVELQVNFIDNILIKHMTKEQRYKTLVWLLETVGIKHNADLQSIAGKCSDFGFVDLETLVLHTIKRCYESLSDNEKNADNVSLTLNDEQFNKSYEWMQRIFSDEIGAPKIPEVHWEDIGGLADLKQEIMKRIEMPMLMCSKGEKSGLLLYGPPGTGKTLLAKAVATEYQFHFLSVKGPELLNLYVGQSEENVRQIFEKARAAAPCIVFFDELDSLAPNRGRSGDSGGVMDRIVSQLLTEMDGIDSNGHVVIIGATNRPDLIDPALLRPGRFDKMLYVGMYEDKDSQKSVLKALTRKFNLENHGTELDEILEFLPSNVTGADLYAICTDAWMIAIKRLVQSNEEDLDFENQEFQSDPVIVNLSDFKEALRDFKPSVSVAELEKYRKLRDEIS